MNKALTTSLNELAVLLGLSSFTYEDWPISLTIDKRIVVYINPLGDEHLVLFCSAGILTDEKSARTLMRDNLFNADVLRPQLCLAHDSEKLLIWNKLPIQGISGSQIYQALIPLVKRAQELQSWLEHDTTPDTMGSGSVDITNLNLLQV